MSILLDIILFLFGISVGFHLRGAVLAKMDWSILKWDSDVFAYRLAPKGYKINRGDKVFMAIKVPTSNVPEDGMKYE